MEQELTQIINLLTSNELPTTLTGLEQTHKLLMSLLPSIKQYQNLLMNTNNNALMYNQRHIKQNRDLQQLIQFQILQDNFQYNLLQYLLPIYDKYELTLNDYLLSNQIIQGILLIHPNSKRIFSINHHNMKIILDLLDGCNNTNNNNNNKDSANDNIKLSISLISTLIHILLKNYDNYRIFEDLNGCSILIKHFKLSSFENINDQNNTNTNTNSNNNNNEDEELNNNLNFKIIEFLMLYLSEEIDNSRGGKSIQEKSQFFINDFPEIDSLIENLNQLNNL